MRGEYIASISTPAMNRELPPRARRIRQVRFRNIPNDGTTSACAENTLRLLLPLVIIRNYLRVRGEYCHAGFVASWLVELPPRARRIQVRKNDVRLIVGTTSACAENTHAPNSFPMITGNYLRVRGEYLAVLSQYTPTTELPPRARRIR